MKNAGFVADTTNAFCLHVGPANNKFSRKAYAREQLGAICTFHRTSRNPLTQREMDDINNSIIDHLNGLPPVTLFGMNMMGFWQGNRKVFIIHDTVTLLYI